MPAKHMPSRMCVRCRSVRLKPELLRMVRLPCGEIVADKTGRAMGRSAYVCADLRCVEGALKARLFELALHQPTPADQAEALVAMAQSVKAAGVKPVGKD